MVCLENIFSSPLSAGLVTGLFVLIYIYLLSYSPYLPPAFFLSIMAGLFVYLLKGGTLLCSQISKTVAEEQCTRNFQG